jgi:hypothetical protein
MRKLYMPQEIAVLADAGGRPLRVAAKRVAAVREEWLVQDGWWAGRSLHRRYFELVLEDGSDVVVFCAPRTGDWFKQRA